MSVGTHKVFDEALSLPADVRMELVERLLESLNGPTDPEIDALWEKEAERRIEQIDKGEVVLIPAEKVFSDIRRKFGW